MKSAPQPRLWCWHAASLWSHQLLWWRALQDSTASGRVMYLFRGSVDAFQNPGCCWNLFRSEVRGCRRLHDIRTAYQSHNKSSDMTANLQGFWWVSFSITRESPGKTRHTAKTAGLDSWLHCHRQQSCRREKTLDGGCRPFGRSLPEGFCSGV